jgi:hypothetical protein
MDIDYYMKIQNAYGIKDKREKELYKVNKAMSRHSEDTFDTEDVLVNNAPMKLMIIKDTDGNTYKKKIKSCHEDKFNLGDYVIWNNQVWLITLVDSDEKTWNRGYMYLCSILLRWQNANGDIVERWGYSEDFTKYSTGVTGNSVVTVGDYQYGLTVPVDEETKVLKRDRRFPIDIDGVEPPDVYKLTNRKILLTDDRYFQRGGILVWTLSFDSFNPEVDKLVELEDQSKVWICDYKPHTTPPLKVNQSNILSIVHKGTPDLKIGASPKEFTGVIKDANGNELTDTGAWELITIDELLPLITYEIDGNSIYIQVANDNIAIGGTVRLQFSTSDGLNSAHLDLNIVNMF